ncbi:MAG: cobalamin [Clostridia bacterium]|nr:cobalamin [Clostridia bacterium]
MHMADALITIKIQLDDTKIPLMGVMGAFVFATQMINFSIPGTGSSGHLGGGMLLAALLGPYAGFVAMAAILSIQALFFADGGLLALGCNIFNLGFYTCFVAYPFIYKRMLSKGYSTIRIAGASMAASIIGLQLGSFSVVVQTMLSGKIDLPFITFALLMQGIHLAIGIVEGLVTAAVINFVWKARPELIEGTGSTQTIKQKVSFKRVLLILIIVTIIIGAVISLYASGNPDGLEWALFNSTGQEEFEEIGGLHQWLGDMQSKFAFLPDYSLKEGVEVPEHVGTSISGVVGAIITLMLAAGVGIIIKNFNKKPSSKII